ncbi:MAG: anti-sigma factor antagonist [Snowella sp.]|nr:anti-sigma factor antagonist [Snowella sp.]
MEIQVKSVEEIHVVELKGDIDASTADDVTKQLSMLVTPKARLLVNMSQVPYMSSAGLRTLLSIHRQTLAKDGKLVLVGLSEELIDTMSVTGFLDFFVTADTEDAGLAALA